MKRKTKRTLAMLICAAALALTACGGTEQEGTGQEGTGGTESSATGQESEESQGNEEGQEGDGDITTLSIYTKFGYNGIDGYPWFEEYLGERLGIYLESRIQTNDNSVLAPMLAGNDLTDIIGMQLKTEVNNAVTGNMMLDLEEHKDKLPNIFGNERYEAVIEYMKDCFGGVYVMPMEIGPNRGINYNPQLRWDLYKKVGMPEIKDFYELLDVMKQMQELQPQTEDGLPVYGMGWFNDWAGNTRMEGVKYGYMPLKGYDEGEISSLVYIKKDGNGEVKYLLDDDSVYKEGLQWLFTANQMGLLDPESATMNWDAYGTKVNNGQYLCTTWNWWGNVGDYDAEDWWGYASVWTEDMEIAEYANAPVGCPDRFLGISANCKDVDKALAFVDWVYSDEGIDMLMNGPEGMLWEYDETGKRILTDLYYETLYVGEDCEHPDGGSVRLSNIFATNPLNGAALDENGQTRSIFGDSYAQVKHTTSKLGADFIENNGGYKSRYERAEAEGKNLVPTSPAFSFVNPAPDDIDEIRAQIGDILVANSWKMVFAADQAEFDAIWKQTQEDAEALGGDKVYEDAVSRWNEAVQTVEKYIK